mgnify:FL=1
MKRIHLFRSVTITLLLALTNLATAADSRPLRALMVTGGCCHDY